MKAEVETNHPSPFQVLYHLCFSQKVTGYVLFPLVLRPSKPFLATHRTRCISVKHLCPSSESDSYCRGCSSWQLLVACEKQLSQKKQMCCVLLCHSKRSIRSLLVNRKELWLSECRVWILTEDAQTKGCSWGLVWYKLSRCLFFPVKMELSFSWQKFR